MPETVIRMGDHAVFLFRKAAAIELKLDRYNSSIPWGVAASGRS